jgi:hypothetical protein
MFSLIVILGLTYSFIAVFFSMFRCIKIIDLYREYQIVRAREQKVHIKSHAQLLCSEIKSDLTWPVTLLRDAKGAWSWMREK